MSSGEKIARHYETSHPVRVVWRDGVIVSVEPTTAPTEQCWIAPALVDLQVNGFAGVDFQQDAPEAGALLGSVTALAAAGCTRFLLTLVTDDWTRLIQRLHNLRQLRENSAELRSAIAGWHIEGPFLSAEPGFRGAHDPKWMCDPTRDQIRVLRESTGSDRVLLTIAPERPGALDAIRFAVSLGFKVSLGHTNAPLEILGRAVEAGATAFTHLGNGCPRELDRHDNILWRVFDLARENARTADAPAPPTAASREVFVSLIPDAMHVSPGLFRLAHRVLGDSVMYVSDAMSAAGAPPGRHKLGGLELEVGADQVVRFPGGTNFAGSALRPIDGVFRAAQMLGRRWQEVWNHFSVTPARMLGIPCELVCGARADFCVLDESAREGTPRVVTYASGRRFEI